MIYVRITNQISKANGSMKTPLPVVYGGHQAMAGGIHLVSPSFHGGMSNHPITGMQHIPGHSGPPAAGMEGAGPTERFHVKTAGGSHYMAQIPAGHASHLQS